MKTRIWSALLVGEGDDQSFLGYTRLHHQCEICSRMTVERHKCTLELWHLLIGLMREALDGTHDFALYGELAASKELRARFQVVVLSTSKAVLDCAVSGLYVQGLALTRHLFETWQRLVYLDLNPGSAFSCCRMTGRSPLLLAKTRLLAS